MVLPARLCTQKYVHKKVTVGANLYRLIYIMLIELFFLNVLAIVNSKKY